MIGVELADVSEHNGKPYDERYPHRLVSVRVAFGVNYADHLFAQSVANIERAYGDGKIDGAFVYAVPIAAQGGADQHVSFWTSLIGSKCPEWLVWMMSDWEVWQGESYEQHGDHSQLANEIMHMCAQYVDGHARNAGWYANRFDAAELIPHRRPHPGIVASYGSELVIHDVDHAIGQQYTNGVIRGPAGLPLGSEPWGSCDMNLFPGFTSAASLRAHLRPTKGGHDVHSTEVQKMIQDAITPMEQRNKIRDSRLTRDHSDIVSLTKRVDALDGQHTASAAE